jgi:hypothetical protein
VPRITAELNVGQRVDVQADRVGRGADGFIEATLRGAVGRFGIESEQKLQHNVIRRGGRQVLADSAARWLGVLHFSARDSLRAVWQGSRLRREADAPMGIAALREDTRTASLVFQHRVGLGRSISVGATRATVQPGDERRDEIFFKAAFAL